MPFIMQLAYHGAKDDDPVAANSAASAAWRLFAHAAAADLKEL
jgi:hypothetical protein